MDVSLGSTITRPTGRVFVSKGFTIVELVVTIIILGVIASVAGPKFFGTSSYEAMGFSQTLSTSLGYAQKLAMNTGCNTRVVVASGSMMLYQGNSACADATLIRPVVRVTGGDFSESIPGGLSVDSFDLYFDARGRPHEYADSSLVTSTKVINVDGGSRLVKVEAETGFVYVE
jgi:MSHA pilin protein MshC